MVEQEESEKLRKKKLKLLKSRWTQKRRRHPLEEDEDWRKKKTELQEDYFRPREKRETQKGRETQLGGRHTGRKLRLEPPETGGGRRRRPVLPGLRGGHKDKGHS